MKSISILNTILKKHIYSPRCFFTSLNRYSTESVKSNTKKVEVLFLNQEVQKILKKITGLDYDKVFAPKAMNLRPHKYEFMTESRLKELQNTSRAIAYKRLQMPPVMDIREPIDEVLSKDPELQGYLTHRTIFIDTSSSATNRDRIITVREIDGTLRRATWEERHRMNQIFFPINGRHLEIPQLFERSNLDRLFSQGEYAFVLDSTCAQFEPDSPEYHKVTSETYEHIKKSAMFDVLRSTRHFGPMAFYFAFNKNIDDLLVDMIRHSLISDASDTVKLLYILHPELKPNIVETDEIAIVQDYIKNCSTEKDNLELALQTFFEQLQAKESEEFEEQKEITA